MQSAHYLYADAEWVDGVSIRIRKGHQEEKQQVGIGTSTTSTASRGTGTTPRIR
jgi:hypothetical protein